MIPRGAIVLLKDFTLVGDAMQVWNTEWVRFPPRFQNAQLVIDVKAIQLGTSATVFLETAYGSETAFPAATGFSGSVFAPGVTQIDVTTRLGDLVHLMLRTNSAATQLTLSAWLTPKRN